MLVRSVAGVAGLALVLTGAAHAQTLAQRDLITQDKQQLALYAKRVNTACDTHLLFKINYGTYTHAVAGAGVRKQSPTEYLMNAGDAIINICATPDGKAAVKSKITSVVGAYADTEQESLSSGVFTYKVSYAGGSVDSPENYLKAHL